MKALLFDLDGTLVDGRVDIAEAFLHAAASLRPDQTHDAQEVDALIGRPLEDMAASLGLELSAAEAVRFVDGYRERYDALACRRTCAYPAIPETLARFGPTHELAVVTAKMTRQARMSLAATGLSEHFNHVQGWEPGAEHKPSPDLVLRALDALGVTPREAVMVGDTSADILAGRAAGTRTVGVSWGFGTRAELEAAEPDHLVETAGELLGVI